MKIKTLTLKNYRKFKNHTFEFESGLNVVLGNNEAGKSTLASSLLDCIYADVNTRSKSYLNKVQSWQKENKPFIELKFSIDKSEYLLTKDFENRNVSLKKINHEDRQTDPKKVQNFLIKNFGISDEDIYINTGFVKQQDISRIDTNAKLIADLQTASREQTRQVDLLSKVKKIKLEIVELKKGLSSPAKHPGLIKKLQDSLEKLTSELNEMKSKWDQALSKIKMKEELESKYREDEVEYKNLKANVENTEKYRSASLKIKEVLSQISQVSNDISKINELRDNVRQIDIKLSRYSGLLSIDRTQVVQTFRSVAEQNNLLDQENLKIQQQIDRMQKSNIARLIYILPVLAIVMFGGAFGTYLVIKNLFIFFVLFSLGIVPLFLLVYLYLTKKEYFSIRSLKSKQKENMVRFAENEQKLEQMVKNYNVDSKEDFLKADDEINNLITQKSKFNEIIQNLLRDQDIKTLEDKYHDLLIVKKDIEVNELNPEILNSKLDSKEYIHAQNKIVALSKEIERTKGEIIMIKTELESLDVYREDIVRKESELERIESNLNFYRKRLKVLEILVEYLEKSIENTSAMVATILRKDIQKYFSQITNGKYNEVKFETNLTTRILSNEAGGWVDPFANLSEGALDQLNFLVRLAYFKLIRKDKNPFMILDDPFVNFDKQRRENAMEIVAKEAQNFQIFFFTHNKEYASYGNVVKL